MPSNSTGAPLSSDPSHATPPRPSPLCAGTAPRCKLERGTPATARSARSAWDAAPPAVVVEKLRTLLPDGEDATLADGVEAGVVAALTPVRALCSCLFTWCR